MWKGVSMCSGFQQLVCMCQEITHYYTTMKRKRALPAFLGVVFPSFRSADAVELPVKLWFASMSLLLGS